ncbi:MAG: hypothetical protein KKA51_04615 [Nanoarchaeota archaeon]|nr:hypothetical protein [Nanoarchaeota archaeon]
MCCRKFYDKYGSKKRITKIKLGEYVKSLDEETGEIVSNKVKALLDMGDGRFMN